MTNLLHFEDFAPGAVATYPGPVVTAESIVAFARRYDPQPMHVDPEAAKAGFAGGLIASGWQTACLHMRMIADDLLHGTAGMGSGGLDELRWVKPVRPGDALSGRRTVLEATPSRSKPDRGFLKFLFEVLDQQGQPVMTLRNGMLVRTRVGAAAAPTSSTGAGNSSADAETLARARPANEVAPAGLPAFDDIAIGESVLLGEHAFSADDIVAFARDYDPQPFHISEEGGRTSHFGGLVASGWQTAACFMPHFVAFRRAQAEASRVAGRTPPELGPSPGVKDLRWLAPVRPGDTIRYVNTTTQTRRLQSRPGWGVVTGRTDGFNQRGEKVFTMEGAGLWQAP